ncbi:sodium:solute symporter family protein [Lentibacillus amyloliquefaciens]|uniref:Na+:solute symporter n=1 Tax=Lentibacillus amyloliquefaciens TaxID=1472767 RepID=A0A0U4E5A4_9BACI|nr:sodium:solute symporter family protein [Lentibacillus amyloliquefaciens]ALX48444.1 Na+:solute symporter [Lentibacillus amyloliquefaciens]
MQIMETIILGVYLVLMTLIGIYFTRRAHSSESDYWTAGKSINTFVGAFALFAALASSSSLMGAVGSGVALGIPFLFAYGFGAVAILPFTLFLVSGQIRRSGVNTLPEFFKQRYGNAVQVVAVAIVVIGMTFYMVPQLTASGLIGSYVLGIDYTTAVIVLGIGFTVYAALGGMWAITYTDLIQGSVMLVGMLVLSLIILFQHDGFSSLIQDALSVTPTFGDITQPWMSYFGLFLAFLWFGIVSPSAVMRNFASRDARTARRSAMWACLLYLLIFGFGLIVAAGGASLGIADTLNNQDMIFVSVIENYMSPLLAGIMLSGLLAAIMSSADAMLLAISAGVARDIYKEYINKEASEQTVTRIGFVVMIIASIVGIIIAINPPQLIAIMVGWVGGFLLSSFGFPLVLGIWWNRANKAGALAGMLGGALTFLILVITKPFALVSEPIIASPISLLLVIVVSLMTAPPSAATQEQINRYHADPSGSEAGKSAG